MTRYAPLLALLACAASEPEVITPATEPEAIEKPADASKAPAPKAEPKAVPKTPAELAGEWAAATLEGEPTRISCTGDLCEVTTDADPAVILVSCDADGCAKAAPPEAE